MTLKISQKSMRHDVLMPIYPTKTFFIFSYIPKLIRKPEAHSQYFIKSLGTFPGKFYLLNHVFKFVINNILMYLLSEMNLCEMLVTSKLYCFFMFLSLLHKTCHATRVSLILMFFSIIAGF